METNRNEGKEDDMIVLFSLTNTDSPLHGELEKHLSEVKEQVSRISSIKPVHKIHIPNGYVMTTRPEYGMDINWMPNQLYFSNNRKM